MPEPRDDQLVERLVPDFVTRDEGVPIWKMLELGAFFDADDLLMVMHFDDHRLLDVAGTPGNYFIGTRGERALNGPANASASSRGAMTLVPSQWKYHPAIQVLDGITNEYTNPSFELNTTNAAAVSAAIAITLDEARYGAKSLEITTNNAIANEGWSTNQITLAANQTHTAAFWFRGTAGYSYIANLTEFTGAAVYVDTVQVSFTGTGRWQRVSVSNAFGATGGLGQLFVRTAAQRSEVFYCDGVDVFQNMAYDIHHVDGDMGDGYSWTGVPHGSTSTRVASEVDLSAYVNALSIDTLTISTRVQMPYASTASWPHGAVNYVFDIRGANNNNRIYIVWADAGKFIVYINGVNRITDALATFDAGETIHLILTCDFASDEYKLYMNGVLIGEDDTALSTPSLTTYWKLGARFGGTRQSGMMFAEHVVLNRILTETEIRQWWALRRPVIDAQAVDKQLPCGIDVFRSTVQNIPSAAWTTLQLDTLRYNEHMVFDTANYRVYVTQPGWYNLSVGVRWANAGGNYRALRITVNGSIIVEQFIPPVLTTVTILSAATTWYLIPGDYIELQAIQDSGAGLNIDYGANYSPFLRVIKIRNVFPEVY